MTRRQRTAINDNYRKKWEAAFYSPVLRALKYQISSFISDVKKEGLTVAQSRLTYQILNEKMAIVISGLYRVAGVDAANRELRKRKQEPMIKGRTFGFNAEWAAQIQDYFRMHLFDKVVLPITETTKEQLQRKIQEMIDNGESIEWLVQQVKDKDFTDWRARMIARTESNRAINYGQQIGAEKSKFKLNKEWVAVHDDRTRHSHLLLDGKIVGEFDEFKPGLQFPGDPNGAPGETINCRCHLEYHSVRDANGRLIPKEPNKIRVTQAVRQEFQDIIAALN
jgi:SPP1 gp7 family putative phage head morphogenesis protein